tara:strand:- start:2142 stop:5216 length:3075 start_codon:yes stop_codon:yes gene_type:complete
MEKQHIILEYDKYKKMYSKKYGAKTVILMQLGGFYELCAALEEDVQYGETDIYNLCDNILNIAVAKKKNKTSKSTMGVVVNYLQAGFPLVSKEKFINILLKNCYTIVIVDQITQPPNVEREVKEILSPGTCLYQSNSTSNYLMSIYIEKYNYKNLDVFQVGISTIDLSTGKNYYHDILYDEDENYWSDEISKFLNFYEPSEILIHTENYELCKSDVINIWDINHDSIHINHFDDQIYKRPSYQNQQLNRIFKLQNMVEPLEYFELIKKPEVTLSYIYMIIYIYQHKNDILNNIEYPIEYKNINYLSLNSNCARQLNVVSNYSYYKGKNESLYEICNICSTNMGKRLLKQRLLYPLIDPLEINKRYDLIEIIKTENLYDKLSDKLKYISDLEKMLRIMGLNLLDPYDLFSAKLSYEYVNTVLNIIDENTNVKKKYEINLKIKEKYIKFYEKLICTFNFEDIQNVPTSQANNSLFIKGIYPEIDIVDEQIKENVKTLNCICKTLSKIIDSKNDFCVKYCNDKNEQWYLYCTNKRANTFENNLKNINKSTLNIRNGTRTILKINKEYITYKKNDKSNTILYLEEVDGISKKLKNLYRKLSKLNIEYYNLEISNIYKENRNHLKYINEIVAEIDFSCVGAKLSIKNNYSRPIIKESNTSYAEFYSIRHPIVEKINKEVEYVVNDIKIGKKNNGILLFGTNACGKSTFMKAVGLNIIMAQAGLYVAASKLIYSPYKQIFTRILNNDNIFRSQSSFAVEIEELRSILKRSCDKSLVLGDELCSGTETKSALSIVSAGLYELSKRNCNFVFTSHLHQLMDIKFVQNIETLHVYHLKILYENGKLIYDRKLEPGSGPPVYGLKVCEALGLPSDFLKIANNIQNCLENLTPKLSTYNKDMIIDKCEICGNPAEETDHINEQKNADDNGMIKHFHKNSKHNLVGLCKKCHKQKTNGILTINGWEQTSTGIKLKYNYNDTKKSKKKFNGIQVKKILEYKNYYIENVSNCIKIINLHLKINISKYLLKKIMEENYL